VLADASRDPFPGGSDPRPPRKTGSSSTNGTKVTVVLAPDDEDTLAATTVGVRVFQNVDQLTTLDVEDDVRETDAAMRLELRALASSQTKYFTARRN
jgi:hypothetical protein